MKSCFHYACDVLLAENRLHYCQDVGIRSVTGMHTVTTPKSDHLAQNRSESYETHYSFKTNKQKNTEAIDHGIHFFFKLRQKADNIM